MGTGSMLPVFGEGHNVVYIKVNPLQISTGDIISFQYGNRTYIHRVLYRGYDKYGWYYITKGDNLPVDDGIKIRYDDVEGKVILILY